MSAVSEMDAVDEIAEALEAARLLSWLVFSRAGELDQERLEVGHILTASCLLDQQLDRIGAASTRWAQTSRATVPARGSTVN